MIGKPNLEESLNPCMLFVRGIPYDCSNETLEEVFSKAGAVRKCFIVKNQKTEDKSHRPCIGYVTYMRIEDAKSALQMENDFIIDGSKLRISLARKKLKKKATITENDETEAPVIVKKEKSEGKESVDDPEYADQYTVQVSGLPALYKKEHVLTVWKKCGLKEPVSLEFPCENIDSATGNLEEGKDQRQTARFVVDSKQAALKAYNKLAGKVIGKKRNYMLKVVFLTPEGNFKAARKSKLIVRNLSFQCTEEDLKNAFDSYGTITEVKIPTKPDGKKRGFGFVQFTHVFEAMRALKAMNMQEIKGRKVAIDWSVPQKQYLEMNSTTGESNEKSTLVKEKKSTGDKTDSEASDEEETDDHDSDQGLGDSEEEGDSADDDEMEEQVEDESDEDDDGLDDDSGGESIPKKVVKSKKKHSLKTSHDVHEGRTVFVQNLAFDVSEDGLAQAFSEYGHICYAKIAINSETGMSKGCAFVQFKTPEEASNCIDALTGEENGKILNGKEIRVCQAVSRTDVKKMLHQQKKQKNETEDKRNLYLGREGLVRPGTQAAEGLSAIELKKREKIENMKRAKLKNPNVFFSTTRLCVHNLPRSVDDKKLKELLLSQFKDRRGVVITESRVMRDLKNVNEDGVGRPLGFAFVNFTKHEHALKALRSFNNNPDIFGPIKRPIVEFSLENRKALELKEQRKAKFLTKQKLKKEIGSSNDAATTPNPKRQRFKRKSSEDSFSRDKKQKVSHNSVSQNEKTTLSADSSNPTRLPFQGSVGMTASGKKLPLPHHTKPKIRSRDKGKVVEQMRRSKKLNSKSEQRKVMQKYREQKEGKNVRASAEKPKKSKKSAAGKDREFDDLVSKYTRAFSSKLDLKKVPGKKWFEV